MHTACCRRQKETLGNIPDTEFRDVMLQDIGPFNYQRKQFTLLYTGVGVGTVSLALQHRHPIV